MVIAGVIRHPSYLLPHRFIKRSPGVPRGFFLWWPPQSAASFILDQRFDVRFWHLADDLPPLVVSLRYVLTMDDEIDGEEAAYGRRGCRKASAG